MARASSTWLEFQSSLYPPSYGPSRRCLVTRLQCSLLLTTRTYTEGGAFLHQILYPVYRLINLRKNGKMRLCFWLSRTWQRIPSSSIMCQKCPTVCGSLFSCMVAERCAITLILLWTRSHIPFQKIVRKTFVRRTRLACPLLYRPLNQLYSSADIFINIPNNTRNTKDRLHA